MHRSTKSTATLPQLRKIARNTGENAGAGRPLGIAANKPGTSIAQFSLEFQYWDANRGPNKTRSDGMADDTDLHVGKRLRRRRRLLGMTQQDLASQVGVRFQQIQKYECGANRVTASRLFDLSRALNVSVQYFFDGIIPADSPEAVANDSDQLEGDILSQKETLELVRAYYRLGERPRRRLLELAKALESDANDIAS